MVLYSLFQALYYLDIMDQDTTLSNKAIDETGTVSTGGITDLNTCLLGITLTAVEATYFNNEEIGGVLNDLFNRSLTCAWPTTRGGNHVHL